MSVGEYYQDMIFLLIGISIFIDIIVLIGTLRVNRMRKIRIVRGIFLISVLILAYLMATLLDLLGYISFSGSEVGILLVFSILLVFYVGILRGLS